MGTSTTYLLMSAFLTVNQEVLCLISTANRLIYIYIYILILKAIVKNNIRLNTRGCVAIPSVEKKSLDICFRVVPAFYNPQGHEFLQIYVYYCTLIHHDHWI